MNWGPWYIANLKNRQNGQERLVVHTYARERKNKKLRMTCIGDSIFYLFFSPKAK